MKRFFLSLLLLQGVSEVQAELTKEEKALVVAGAATGLSCLWFWNRESNSTKINRAHKLYSSCRSAVGRHEQYLIGDAEVMLQQLRSCSILQRADEIMSSYSELNGRNGCFWNKSDDLSEACHMMKRLKQNLDDYEFVKKQLSQQVLIKHINQLWSQLSHYNVHQDLSIVVHSHTLQQLQKHSVVAMQSQISSFYEQVVHHKRYKEVMCSGFEQAYERMMILYNCLQKYTSLIQSILQYESITATYSNILLLDLDTPVGLQNVISEARSLGSGKYLLINFVEQLSLDLKALQHLKLQPSYVKHSASLLSDYRYTKGDVLGSVLSVLNKTLQVVSTSLAYQDEVRRREEQRMHEERMRLEQERLRLERERLRAEQARVEAERERVRAEQRRAQAEQERARAQRYKNSTDAELDRACVQQEQQRKQKNSTDAQLDAAYAEQERRQAYDDYNCWW